MRVTRLNKIRGHRLFRSFTWPDDLLPFGHFNLIYGWNGSGKTTLASIFRHLENRTAISEGEVEFEIDGASKIAGRDLASAVLPSIRVFNRDFIEATILASCECMEPIYYLGQDSIEKQRQVAGLRKELEHALTAIATAGVVKDHAEKALDDFYINQARVIKGLLISSKNTSYNNYDKRTFRRAIEGLTEDACSTALLKDEDKERLRKQKDAQPKSEVAAVSVRVPHFVEITTKAETLLKKSVVSQVIDELVADREIGGWVQRGLELHSDERRTGTCRFCAQPLSTNRRAALEAHFNDAFSAFQTDVASELESIERHRADLANILFPESSRLYGHLSGDLESIVVEARRLFSEATKFLDAIREALNRKKDAPFEDVRFPSHETGTPDSGALSRAIESVNAVVEKHNTTTRSFQTSVDEACKALERSYVAEVFSEYREKRVAFDKAIAVLQELSAKPKPIQDRIAGIEREIIEHRKPAEEINTELCAYLGHDELRLDVKESGYTMTRAGQPATHLSEGEKTAIAFLYFLKSLQDKAFTLSGGLVVIDDPVSSLDANALFSAFGYMKERTKGAGQLFILTHNFAFFRQAKNWFHHLPNQRKRDPNLRPGRFYLLRAYVQDGQRSASLGPIDMLLEHYESEYHYLFKTVQEEVQRADSDVSLAQYYGMPNIARRLLEAFMAFRHPDLQGDLAKQLERVDFEPEKKIRILRLLHTYSHSGSIGDPEHDPTVLSETKAILRDLLALIKNVDPVHYESMMRLISTQEAVE
jgi:wobble nucleotide-excising tRNase